MANTVSALKRVRITERRTEINRARKSRLKSALKNMRKLIAANNQQDAEKGLPALFSTVDRMAKSGVIKKNTAARYKSRITKRVRSIAA
ncbi:MAG: 30S ribosomal protein S20 [Bryobacter sp.]|nr:30S ribosomal protein S20 [Bryobacter sp.]